MIPTNTLPLFIFCQPSAKDNSAGSTPLNIATVAVERSVVAIKNATRPDRPAAPFLSLDRP